MHDEVQTLRGLPQDERKKKINEIRTNLKDWAKKEGIDLIFVSPFNRTKRQHSGDVRSWLLDMEKRGLVKRMDDQKPVCWLRTKAGTRWLR